MPDILLFELDARRFALPVAHVRETVGAVAVTPLAGAPGVIEGVIDAHGVTTPVLDLRARFGLRPRPVTPSDHLVLAMAGARPVALRVDRAVDVLHVSDEQLDRAEPEDVAQRHLAGVLRLDDGLVLVADLEAFLSQGEAEALAVALADAESSAAESTAAEPASADGRAAPG